MSKVPNPALFFRALLLAVATSSAPMLSFAVPSEETAQAPAGEEGLALISKPRDLQALRNAIHKLESGQGAYSDALPEQLLSLGINLQQQGEHDEAVKLFRRGVHLSRINNGLYSVEQIPLLQREISSHLSLGEYAKADERQHYLYRVQMRGMDSGLGRATALMQQAHWQHQAYRLDLDGQGYPRLMSIWDLNRLALNDIIAREGQTSASLLKPLQGMLLAQYLIANYRPENGSSGFSSGESQGSQQQANRFNAYRSQSYKKGQAVIRAIYDIQQVNHGENSLETVEALTMLGDWVWWHGEQETALSAYQNAIAELVARDDAQQEIDRIFGQPVALPNFDGVRPLPAAVPPREDTLSLEFTITTKGKVRDLERLDENEFEGNRANRIMRILRKTRFRPQLTMGEPVNTEKTARAYDIQ